MPPAATSTSAESSSSGNSSPNSLKAQWSYDGGGGGGGGGGARVTPNNPQHLHLHQQQQQQRQPGEAAQPSPQPSSQQLQALRLGRNSSTASNVSVDPQPLPPGSHYHIFSGNGSGGGTNGGNNKHHHDPWRTTTKGGLKPLLAPHLQQLQGGSGGGSSASSVENRSSTFRACLRGVDVPSILQTTGVECIRVHATNGKVEPCWLTLSHDKFTLYVSRLPLYGDRNNNSNGTTSGKKKSKSTGGWFFGFGGGGGNSSSGITNDNATSQPTAGIQRPSTITRSASDVSATTQPAHNLSGSGRSSGSGSGGLHNNNSVAASATVTATTTSKNKKEKQSVRAIDVGAITRIQRGYANRKFEVAAAVQQQQQQQASSNRQLFKKHGSVRSLLSDETAGSTSVSASALSPAGPVPLTHTTSSHSVSSNGGLSTATATSSTSTSGGLQLNPTQCFSLIFRGDWTLDLMMVHPTTTFTTTQPSSAVAKSSFSRSTSSPPSMTSTTNTTPSNNTTTTTTSNINNNIRDEVLDGLDRVIRTYQRAKRQVSNDVLLLRYVWLDADKDQSNTIKPNEIGGVLDKINYQMKKNQLNELYDSFAKVIGLDKKQRKQGLTFEQTCTLLHKIKRDQWIVKPINKYWNQLFGEHMKNGKPRMTVSDKTFLEKFLHNSQGETRATIKDVHRLFARLNDMELPYVSGEGQMKDPTRIDKNRFEAFLLSRDNDVFDPARETYDARTMNHPISEYWINSSHNTYLTGDQLTSASSIDMYSNALYRGCKCLELDVWDGWYGGDSIPVPVVWHGHTMTSKILFKDIIKAIKLYLNFHPDSFPIILSFENHCTIPYQEVMAEQLVRILGSSLYMPKEDSLLGRLPSPMDLRGMVVIKGRRPLNMDMDEYDVDLSDDEEAGAPSTAPSSTTFATTDPSSANSPSTPKVHHRVSPALARLTLLHGSKLRSWDSSVMNPTHHMHSFSESKIRSLAKKSDRRKWVIYNQSHMTRSYPAGSRVDSSNYMPCLPWSVGTQMVALNFQTIDASLLLNDGRFRENGNCGYVLKPSSLMDIQDQLQQQAAMMARMGSSSSNGSVGGSIQPTPPPLRLSIRILSGSCLPKPDGVRSGDCINPYVKVTVYDVQSGIKESTLSFQTAFVTANGFFPIWNSEKFQFVIDNPAVAMIQLSVYDKRTSGVISAANPNAVDTFVAGAAIPVSCLRRGLRSVKLFDTSNTRSGAFDFASLLIEVRKNDRSRTTATTSSTPSPVVPVPSSSLSPSKMTRSRGSGRGMDGGLQSGRDLMAEF